MKRRLKFTRKLLFTIKTLNVIKCPSMFSCFYVNENSVIIFYHSFDQNSKFAQNCRFESEALRRAYK